MTNRLTLVGYRACGKSTVGPLIAKRLDWRFCDADRVLESQLGMTIGEFFAAKGEAAFRDLEEAMLAKLLADHQPLVLATGGGAILREANRRNLRTHGGLVVYLHAPPTVLQSRLRAHDGGRPSLSGKPVWEEVPDLLAARDPLYREVASLVLDATSSAAKLAAELVTAVEKSRVKPVENSSKPSPRDG